MISENTPAAPGKSAGRTTLVALAVVALAAFGTYKYMHRDGAEAAAAGAPATGGKGGRASGPIPVGTAEARTGDLEVRLNAIGNARALNTVTVRPLVGGTLQKIHFKEGAEVKAGDLLAEVDPRPFLVQKMQAEGALARDEAQLANAKRDLARYREAAEAVTQQQIDTAGASVGQLEGAVLADRAAVDNAKLQIEYSRITAPITGRVGLRLVDEGNVVGANDATGIVVITQIHPISVVFTLPESGLQGMIAAAAKDSALKVVAFDRDNTTPLAEGALAAFDNQLDATTGTVKLRANFDNTDNALFPNQFVNIRLSVGGRKGVTLVPTVAVQIADKERFVYVVTGDGTVDKRAVKPGVADERDTEILDGVKPGETVVTEGLDRLRQGSKVVSSNKAREAAKPGTGKKRGKGMHNE